MQKLGKHKTSVSYLYVKKLSDIDPDVLQELVTKSVEGMREMYGFLVLARTTGKGLYLEKS